MSLNMICATGKSFVECLCNFQGLNNEYKYINMITDSEWVV